MITYKWSRGLAVNRQEGIDVCPYLLRAYLRIGIRVVTRKYNLSSLFEMKDFFYFDCVMIYFKFIS